MKRTRQLTPLGIKIKMALVQKNMTSKELAQRIEAYIAEFEQHGTDNILVDTENP